MDNDFADLAGYFEAFSASPSAGPSSATQLDTGRVLSIQATQAALNMRGYKGRNAKPLVEDNRWGANTDFALQTFVRQYASTYPSSQASGDPKTGTVFLFPRALGDVLVASLQMTPKGRALLAAQPVPMQAAPAVHRAAPVAAHKAAVAAQKPTGAPRAGLVPTDVGRAQDILRALGFSKLKRDGLYGPNTRAAWALAAKSRKVPTDFSRGSPSSAWVDPAALAALAGGPARSGLLEIGVGQAQDILIGLGAQLKRDGLFGPKTKATFAALAIARKLAPDFDRAGPMNAWVDPKTWQALQSQAGAKPATDAKQAPASASKGSKLPTTPSRPGLTQMSVGEAQTLLNTLGAKLKVDGRFGPATRAAWVAASHKRKLKAEFDRSGPDSAWVDPNTQATLQKAAGGVSATPSKKADAAKTAAVNKQVNSSATQQAAKQVEKLATTALLVKTLQQAMLMANSQGNLQGKFPGVKDSGVWDAVTEKGFFTLFAIAPTYVPTWREALKKLVSSSKKSVRLLPDQAKNAGEIAKIWNAQKAAKKVVAKKKPVTSGIPTGRDPLSRGPQRPAILPGSDPNSRQPAWTMQPQQPQQPQQPVQGQTFLINGQVQPQPLQPMAPALPPPEPTPLTPSPVTPTQDMFQPQQQMLQPNITVNSGGGQAPVYVPESVGGQPATDASLSPAPSGAAAPAAQEGPAASSGSSVGLVLAILGVGTLAFLAMNKKEGPSSVSKSNPPRSFKMKAKLRKAKA